MNRKSILLASIISLLLVGCGENTNSNNNQSDEYINPEEEKVDSAKSQLYVSNFNGGYGNEWLYKAKERFEKYYAETSFEEDKKGVQVRFDDNKDQGHQLINMISTSRNEVFFTQNVDYYSYVNQGLIADLTDIMTENLSEKFGEDNTILNKFHDNQKEYFGIDGKYYAIPYVTGFFGLMYDTDLFDQKGFYFAADNSLDANENKYNTAINNGNNGFIYDKTDKKSNGPDGKPGTYDDGLPATYDEYFKLCDYISQAGCIPTIWTGQYRNDYMLDTLRSLTLDYEGQEGELFYSFDGTATHLVKSIDANGNIEFEEPTQITLDNGYETYRTAGRYYAFDFYQRLTSNKNYYFKKCFNETHSHLDAQNDFLFSRPEGNEPIAMIFEGTYWANEAKETFADVAAQFGDEFSQKNRNIGIMPLPKATKDKVGEPYTVFGDYSSLGFVNANCSPDKLKLAKAFLQFVNTDESMREYTVTTNTLKDLKYDLTEEDKAKLSGFGKLLWESKESRQIVFRGAKNPIYINNEQVIKNNGFYSQIGSTLYNRPVDDLRGTSPDMIKSVDYFKGVPNYYNKSWWESLAGAKK